MSDLILQVQGICKTFGAVEASKDISFDVSRGHIHALIGPNGAGKTTVVNQLCGDILPDRGHIMFESEDITRLKPYHRATRGLARSFQITSVFENLTVEENFALAIVSCHDHNFRFWKNCLSEPIVQQALPTALAQVDLTDKAGQLARNLSHGEKRQLEVGMALTGNPSLLILDEPMAGQGPGGTVELSKLFTRLKERVTIILVEHDMDVVFQLADRITVLVYGEAIITGTPGEIRLHPVVRSAYLGDE